MLVVSCFFTKQTPKPPKNRNCCHRKFHFKNESAFEQFTVNRRNTTEKKQ